jgi:hypothetical protein
LVLHFLADKEKKAMITQRLVTLYTHQKVFASRRLLYHSHRHIGPWLISVKLFLEFRLSQIIPSLCDDSLILQSNDGYDYKHSLSLANSRERILILVKLVRFYNSRACRFAAISCPQRSRVISPRSQMLEQGKKRRSSSANNLTSSFHFLPLP